VLEVLGIFISGIAAGALGGLLGIGGGIVLIPFLRFVVGLPPAQAAGVCVVAVFGTTLSGSIKHHKMGNVDIKSILPVIFAGVIATAVFSLLFLWVAAKERWLDLGTGLVFLIISTRMIIEGAVKTRKQAPQQKNDGCVQGPFLQKIVIGMAGGTLPGLLGIGTGGIMVPAFTLILKSPIKTAIGCSLTCFMANALVSAGFKLSQGFVNLTLAGPACAGTIVGAYLGAALNKKCPSSWLKIIFGAAFAYVSMKFILSFCGIRV